jgi:hypothetical protein
MRWYDSDEVLRTCLDNLRYLDPSARRAAVTAAVDAIEGVAPGFLDAHVASFELPLHGRRRWYDDEDAETWLLFHGLERATPRCRDAVVAELLARVVGAAA